MPREYDYYEWETDDGIFEVHQKDCGDQPERPESGDMTATAVSDAEEGVYGGGFDLSCSCLDPVLGSDR